jgi:hypothetical protein
VCGGFEPLLPRNTRKKKSRKSRISKALYVPTSRHFFSSFFYFLSPLGWLALLAIYRVAAAKNRKIVFDLRVWHPDG